MTNDDAIDFEVHNPVKLAYRHTTRLSMIVPHMNFYDIPKDMCTWCGENKATVNLGTVCRRCYFYQKNNFNKRMYQEGICMTCDQLHITDGRLYCEKCKPKLEDKK
jgi:hypothetical protein